MAVTEAPTLPEEIIPPLRLGEGFGAEPEPEPELEATPPFPFLPTALAGGLAAASAAWMVGGIFQGWQARALGVAASAMGAGYAYAVHRFNRPWLHYLLPVFALLVGAMFLAPDAHAGNSNLFGLVVDAVRSGGFLQPPVDLAPGWRLILPALFIVLSAGAMGVAVSADRPRLAPLAPLPLALGAALVQPPAQALLSSGVTIVAILGAFALSYGADLSKGMAGEAGLGAGFELRRLGRSGGMVAGLVIAVVLLNQAGFLFPSPEQDRVVPPQRPQVPPETPDVPLFRVTTNAQTPYRLGVIDIYDVKAGAWLLPAQDNRRLKRESTPATLPGPGLGKDRLTATFVVEQASGHLLPVIGGAVRVTGLPGQHFDYDPLQDTIRLAERPVFAGLTYTVEAPMPASGIDLRNADAPAKAVKDSYLVAPPIPLEVQTLLQKAPQSNSFDRLQYVRAQLYGNVVAAGGGKPVDISAKRAVEVLQGHDASPYEITATEALLARWAGIPSRIGYGYSGGNKQSDGSVEIRPRNGATWLEVYFGKYGWIPIVGTPPHAKPSTSNQHKNQNPAIHPVDDLALVIYLPVRLHTLLPIYVILRYWLLVALPVVAALVALLVFYPGVVKSFRSRKRTGWAQRRGPVGQVAAAYAEFRDRARDLAIGDPVATPLEFLDFLEPDKQHRELAWLVTRVLYGDLWHTATAEHAVAAESLGRSVGKRLTRAQSRTTRMLAFAARNSLRDPYSDEVPNLWWSGARLSAVKLSRGGLRLSPAAAAALIAMWILTACGSQVLATPRPIPLRLVPDRVGTVSFVEEPKGEAVYVKGRRDTDIIVSEGRVFTIHRGDVTEGSLQVARFKAGYSSRDPGVVEAVKQAVGRFDSFSGAPVTAWINTTTDQRIYLWFPPRSDSLALLVLRPAFTATNSDAVARTIIGYEDGRPAPDTISLGADEETSPGNVVLQQPTFEVPSQ